MARRFTTSSSSTSQCKGRSQRDHNRSRAENASATSRRRDELGKYTRRRSVPNHPRVAARHLAATEPRRQRRSAFRSAAGTPPTCTRGSARPDVRARRSPPRCRAARRPGSRRPRAIPFRNPPRNASPTPVGSTIRCGGTAGTCRPAVPFERSEHPFSPRVTTSAPAARQDRLLVEPGLLPDQLELVVVADDEGRAQPAHPQLVAGHARALLTRIPDEGNPQRAALLRVLQHRARIVRRDDRQAAAPARAERQLAGVRHRAGVERRDLVALRVGAAEERRGELVRRPASRATCRRRPPRASGGSRRSPARPSPSGAAARRAAPACRRCSARSRRAACPSCRPGS